MSLVPCAGYLPVMPATCKLTDDFMYVQWADFSQAAAQLQGRAPHALEGGVCSQAGPTSAPLRQEA